MHQAIRQGHKEVIPVFLFCKKCILAVGRKQLEVGSKKWMWKQNMHHVERVKADSHGWLVCCLLLVS